VSWVNPNPAALEGFYSLGVGHDFCRGVNDLYAPALFEVRLMSAAERSAAGIGTRVPVGCPVRCSYYPSALPAGAGFLRGGRYWARTSDLQLVELALSQLS
jgi:hypothetical protein